MEVLSLQVFKMIKVWGLLSPKGVDLILPPPWLQDLGERYMLISDLFQDSQVVMDYLCKSIDYRCFRISCHPLH